MLQILGYCIPSLFVLLSTWLVLQKVYKNETEKRSWELKRTTQKEINSARLRAYERLTLLLERTTPERMLVELNIAEMSVPQVQQHLLRTIRMEFDHNMSQQIYVSNEVWDMLIRARDEMGAFVTTIASQLPAGSSSVDYAHALIQAYQMNGDTPSSIALEKLKDEARLCF